MPLIFLSSEEVGACSGAQFVDQCIAFGRSQFWRIVRFWRLLFTEQRLGILIVGGYGLIMPNRVYPPAKTERRIGMNTTGHQTGKVRRAIVCIKMATSKTPSTK